MGSKNILWIACLFHMLFVVLTLSPDLEKMTIEEYINYINPPAVHKFKNEYGDSILCVNHEDQISLRHLKKNKLDGRMKANGVARPSLKNSAEGSVKTCPEGTVPIMEVKHEQVKAAGSVASFLRRKNIRAGMAQNTSISSVLDPGLVQMFATRTWRYSYGMNSAEAQFGVWQPSLDYNEGIRSGGGVWLTVEGGATVDYVQAAWAVDPGMFEGDVRPRLIAGWTTDGYVKTGCDNLYCRGFVAENNIGGIYLGIPMDNVSRYGDINYQRHTLIRVTREARGEQAVWALYVMGYGVGYYPASLFRTMANFVNRVDFGGVVQFLPRGTEVSTTDMGSGRFPQRGYGGAAYVANVKISTIMGGSEKDCNVSYCVSNPNCYDASTVGFDNGGPDFDNVFYYGGPGSDQHGCVHY